MDCISEEILNHLKHLSCEDVAGRLGMDVRRHRTLCFIHDDHYPSLFFMGNNRDSWFCFVCNKGGNAIDLVKEYTKCSFMEACIWLCEMYQIYLDVTLPKAKNIRDRRRYRLTDISASKPFSKDVALYLLENSSLTDAACHFLFEERKLSPQVIKDLKIVSIDNGCDIVNILRHKFDEQTLQDSGLVSIMDGGAYLRLFTPCLIFPYFDQTCELIGIQSRYLGNRTDAPRFQLISSQKTRLFNLPFLNNMKYGDDLYISEGITDCLALLSSGRKAVAIPSATILPQLDLSMLSKYNLHMVPDCDEAGERAFTKLQHFFIDRFSLLKAERLPAGFKDYSEYYKAHNDDKL